MSQRDDKQFLELYRVERFEDQLGYYKRTREEFDSAKTEAIIGSILLIFLSGAAGIAAATVDIHWMKLLFLLLAAIFPIFSTALAAYNTLYGFEQQAKLYQDTINNLLHARALAPVPEQNLTEDEFTYRVNDFVQEVENTFQKEQGQWGQLAEHFKPSET
jgi:SMODS and SLOG-associating 2TM effector domain 1